MKETIMNQDIEIQLRPLEIDDTNFMIELASNPDITRYLPGMITERKMMENWIKGLETRDHEYIVLLGNREIGECSLTVSVEHSAEIGFMLFPEYCGGKPIRVELDGYFYDAQPKFLRNQPAMSAVGYDMFFQIQ